MVRARKVGGGGYSRGVREVGGLFKGGRYFK